MNPLSAIDYQAAERFAMILGSLWTQGMPISAKELWIAATAAQRGLRILTLDAHCNHVSHRRVDHIPPA